MHRYNFYPKLATACRVFGDGGLGRGQGGSLHLTYEKNQEPWKCGEPAAARDRRLKHSRRYQDHYGFESISKRLYRSLVGQSLIKTNCVIRFCFNGVEILETILNDNMTTIRGEPFYEKMLWATRLAWMSTIGGLPAMMRLWNNAPEFDAISASFFIAAAVIGIPGLIMGRSVRTEFERAITDFQASTSHEGTAAQRRRAFLYEFFLDAFVPFRRRIQP